MYVRPAELKDAARIRDIYNYYVLNTIITEDQTEITVDVAANLIRYNQENKLPILVAVQGKLPPGNMPSSNNTGRRPQPEPRKIILPIQENVIGFASTDRAGFGLSGSVGLHRYTAELKLYVDIKYTRKGVGRNLLDQLIHILNNGYGYRDVVPFVNFNNDPVYKTQGAGLCHMMHFRIPAERRNDPNLPWLAQWFKNSFKFLPGIVLRSWGRTSVSQGDHSRFVDVHILQAEARMEEEFSMNI